LAGPSLISGISYSNPFINRGSNASSGSGEVIYELDPVTIVAERLGDTDGPIAGSGRMIEPIWWGDRNYATNSVYRGSQNTQNIWGRAIFDVASTIAPLPKIGWAIRGLRALRGVSKGTNIVYQGIDKAGVVRYVGITKRAPALRFAEHLNSGTGKSLLQYRAVDGATSLSRTGARVWEQGLINQYGLGKNGGLLLNRINSMAPKNWWQYGIK